MKKKLIIVISIIVIFIVLILILRLIKGNSGDNNINDNKYKVSEPILDKIDKNDDFLLFINDDYNKCSLCEEASRLVSYYSRVYDLDNIWFDKSTTTDEDFNNLIKDFDLQDMFLNPGNVLLVKDGVVVVAINEAIFENTLSDYLVEYKFIDDIDNDKFIEDDDFNKLYNGNDKELVLVYSADDIGYSYREDLFNMANKYNFKYSVIRLGFGDTIDTNEIVTRKMGNKYKLPVLMVVGNGKIIDYTTNKSNSKIEEFLKDNDFI